MVEPGPRSLQARAALGCAPRQQQVVPGLLMLTFPVLLSIVLLLQPLC